MARRSAAVDRGHPFPVPAWWMAAIGKVRDSMTDAQLIGAIELQTGRTYSKFTISRYFTDDNPTTTLELTNDLWETFGKARGIPRPVIVPETRAAAEKLSPVEDDPARVALRSDMRKLEAKTQQREANDHPPVLGSLSGEEERRSRPPAAAGRNDSGRRRQ